MYIAWAGRIGKTKKSANTDSKQCAFLLQVPALPSTT